MAEQERYGRDSSRGYRDDDDRSFGRGGYDRNRDQESGRRSDSLFGSGWSEREERGWGSSGDRSRSDRGGSADYDRDDSDRGRGSRGGFSSGRSDREDRDRGGLSSWFGGNDRNDRNEGSGRDRNLERGDRERGRGQSDDEYRPSVVYKDRTPSGREVRPTGRDDDRNSFTRDERPSGRDRDRLASARDQRPADDDRERGRERDHHGAGDQRGFGVDDQRGGLPIDETNRLIASNKVEGTAVYGLDGERLGSIYNFMVEKIEGKVEYAVMTYGGFLGMGTRYYPLPWQLLKYDTRRGGYRIDLTSRDLERAPSFDRSNEPNFDRNYGERVHSWYGLNYR